MAPGQETLTARLRCLRPVPADEADYTAMLLDPEVQRWLRPPPLPRMRPRDPLDLLERDQEHWSTHGYGPWVLRDRHTDAFVGRGGLCWTTATGAFAVELPWAIVPARWNEGLATEAALAAVARSRELELDDVVSFTVPANAASRRVMEKAGLHLVGPLEHAGVEHVLYRL